MYKLYLFCSAGMSSSLVAKRMQEVAKSKAMPIEVSFFGMSSLSDRANEADIIIITPQIKYQENQIRKDYPEKPVYAIEMLDYGTINAQAILNKCLEYAKITL